MHSVSEVDWLLTSTLDELEDKIEHDEGLRAELNILFEAGQAPRLARDLRAFIDGRVLLVLRGNNKD